MPTWNFHGNQQTILVYAWICSHQALRAKVLQEDKPLWQHTSREVVVMDLLAKEVQLSSQQEPYGGLLRCQIAHVDPMPITATLTESSGIYFNAELQRQRAAQAGAHPRAGAAETELLCAWLEQRSALVRLLERQCVAWQGDATRGGQILHAFFLWHRQLVTRGHATAFVVPELLRLALESVEWKTVAERMLSLATAHSAENAGTVAWADETAFRLASFHSWLVQQQAELRAWDTVLPEKVRELARFASNYCGQAAREIESLNEGTR